MSHLMFFSSNKLNLAWSSPLLVPTYNVGFACNNLINSVMLVVGLVSKIESDKRVLNNIIDIIKQQYFGAVFDLGSTRVTRFNELVTLSKEVVRSSGGLLDATRSSGYFYGLDFPFYPINPVSKVITNAVTEVAATGKLFAALNIPTVSWVINSELHLETPRAYLLPLLRISRGWVLNSMTSLVDILVYDTPQAVRRFNLKYIVARPQFGSYVHIRTAISALEPLMSVVGNFFNAEWLEREIAEMFGIFIAGNPNSTKLVGDYRGFDASQRKGAGSCTSNNSLLDSFHMALNGTTLSIGLLPGTVKELNIYIDVFFNEFFGLICGALFVQFLIFLALKFIKDIDKPEKDHIYAGFVNMREAVYFIVPMIMTYRMAGTFAPAATEKFGLWMPCVVMVVSLIPFEKFIPALTYRMRIDACAHVMRISSIGLFFSAMSFLCQWPWWVTIGKVNIVFLLIALIYAAYVFKCLTVDAPDLLQKLISPSRPMEASLLNLLYANVYAAVTWGILTWTLLSFAMYGIHDKIPFAMFTTSPVCLIPMAFAFLLWNPNNKDGIAFTGTSVKVSRYFTNLILGSWFIAVLLYLLIWAKTRTMGVAYTPFHLILSNNTLELYANQVLVWVGITFVLVHILRPGHFLLYLHPIKNLKSCLGMLVRVLISSALLAADFNIVKFVRGVKAGWLTNTTPQAPVAKAARAKGRVLRSSLEDFEFTSSFGSDMLCYIAYFLVFAFIVYYSTSRLGLLRTKYDCGLWKPRNFMVFLAAVVVGAIALLPTDAGFKIMHIVTTNNTQFHTNSAVLFVSIVFTIFLYALVLILNYNHWVEAPKTRPQLNEKISGLRSSFLILICFIAFTHVLLVDTTFGNHIGIAQPLSLFNFVALGELALFYYSRENTTRYWQHMVAFTTAMVFIHTRIFLYHLGFTSSVLLCGIFCWDAQVNALCVTSIAIAPMVFYVFITRLAALLQPEERARHKMTLWETIQYVVLVKVLHRDYVIFGYLLAFGVTLTWILPALFYHKAGCCPLWPEPLLTQNLNLYVLSAQLQYPLGFSSVVNFFSIDMFIFALQVYTPFISLLFLPRIVVYLRASARAGDYLPISAKGAQWSIFALVISFIVGWVVLWLFWPIWTMYLPSTQPLFHKLPGTSPSTYEWVWTLTYLCFYSAIPATFVWYLMVVEAGGYNYEWFRTHGSRWLALWAPAVFFYGGMVCYYIVFFTNTLFIESLTHLVCTFFARRLLLPYTIAIVGLGSPAIFMAVALLIELFAPIVIATGKGLGLTRDSFTKPRVESFLEKNSPRILFVALLAACWPAIKTLGNWSSPLSPIGDIFYRVRSTYYSLEAYLNVSNNTSLANFTPSSKFHPLDDDVRVSWEGLWLFYNNIKNDLISHILNIMEPWYINHLEEVRAISFTNKLTSTFFFDGVTYWLIALTVFVFFVLFVVTREDKSKRVTNKQLVLALIVCICSVLCFMTRDLLVFFMSFEATLVPLYLIVGYFGSRSEKIKAATYLFVFTLVGSAFLWAGLLYCYAVVGTTNFDALYSYFLADDTGAATVVFWCLVLGFAFKVPVFLLHVWLTVAHVEAPTVGSVLLAGLVLKLGGYGLLRWVVLLLPMQVFSFGVLITWFCAVGYVVATFFAVQQSDLKRFVAYTSISHMNFGVAVLFNHTDIGVMSYVHTMISHGVIATALFVLVGFIYYQAGCRDSLSVNALSTTAPRFAILWFLFIIANAGLPVFSAFPGEFFGLLSLMESNGFMLFAVLFVGFFVTAVYSFTVLVRILYGTLGSSETTAPVRDVPEVLTGALYYVLGMSVFLGLSPDVVFKTAFISTLRPSTLPTFSLGVVSSTDAKNVGTLASLLQQTMIRQERVTVGRYNIIMLMDYFGRVPQWTYNLPQMSALEKLTNTFDGFLFLCSLRDKSTKLQLVNNITDLMAREKGRLFPNDVWLLKSFKNALLLSMAMGETEVLLENINPALRAEIEKLDVVPKIAFGSCYHHELTKRPENFKTLIQAWMATVKIWGDGGYLMTSPVHKFRRDVQTPFLLVDLRNPDLQSMWSYDERHFPRFYPEVCLDLKQIRVPVDAESQEYINKLRKLPAFESFLKHDPAVFTKKPAPKTIAETPNLAVDNLDAAFVISSKLSKKTR